MEKESSNNDDISEYSPESNSKEKSLQNSLPTASDNQNYEQDFSQISEDAATPNPSSVDIPTTQNLHSTLELPSVQSSTHLSARSSKFESFTSGIEVVNESQCNKTKILYYKFSLFLF